MKKLILSMVVLSAVMAVNAQDIPERKTDKPGMMERKRHHGRGGMDFRKLNLTEDQKAQFKTQNESFRKQMEELKKNDGITVKEWKSRSEAIRSQHKKNTENILTTDQKAQLQQMKTEGKAKREAFGKKRGEEMKAKLGLTDAQSAKLDANRKATGEKMKSIRENKSLSEEQKREQMKELHKQQKESMKSILTEEQLKKLKESHQGRPKGDRKKPATI